MSVTPTLLYDGTLTDTLTTTLYTVAGGAQAVISSVTLCNTSSSPVDVTLKVGNTYLYSAIPMAGHATWALGPGEIRRILGASGTIKGGASTGSVIDVSISGVVNA